MCDTHIHLSFFLFDKEMFISVNTQNVYILLNRTDYIDSRHLSVYPSIHVSIYLYMHACMYVCVTIMGLSDIYQYFMRFMDVWTKLWEWDVIQIWVTNTLDI